MPILDQFSLQDKVALVTGGAGLYGRQIVAALAEAGAATIMASRNVDALEPLAAEHRVAGRDVIALPLDQGEEASVLALRDEVLRRYGRVDVLVNNAVSRPMKKGYQDDASTFAESMKVNATGLFTITRAFGDVMAEKNQGGSIINIGSIQGMIGPDPTIYRGTEMSGWYPDYFFHKGGIINFTRFVASYYGAQNIRCNCISAGGFFANQPEPFVSQYSDRTLLGRMAGDSDLMGIIVFLASPASAYITGANIPVDGGYTAI
jgi:NAD(P)-dependent dehydrogenase (short-subunit alcohol dehydrogenase family)